MEREIETTEQRSENFSDAGKAGSKALQTAEASRAKNAEKLAKRKILADEAKSLADSSTIVLSRIYKIIREEAEEGRVKLVWGIDNMSKACIANIKASLEADGYIVSGDTSDDLVIQW